MTENDYKEQFHFWKWFFFGYKKTSGIHKLLCNVWILFHILVGLVLSMVVHESLSDAANTVLLPLIGILVGLSFAWAGNAQMLIQTNEIEMFSGYHEDGIINYIYTYQMAILIILITLVLWGVSGLKIFDKFWPIFITSKRYFVIKWIIFIFTSLTIRECWQVVLGAQWMLIVKKEVKKRQE